MYMVAEHNTISFEGLMYLSHALCMRGILEIVLVPQLHPPLFQVRSSYLRRGGGSVNDIQSQARSPSLHRCVGSVNDIHLPQSQATSSFLHRHGSGSFNDICHPQSQASSPSLHRGSGSVNDIRHPQSQARSPSLHRGSGSVNDIHLPQSQARSSLLHRHVGGSVNDICLPQSQAHSSSLHRGGGSVNDIRHPQSQVHSSSLRRGGGSVIDIHHPQSQAHSSSLRRGGGSVNDIRHPQSLAERRSASYDALEDVTHPPFSLTTVNEDETDSPKLLVTPRKTRPVLRSVSSLPLGPTSQVASTREQLVIEGLLHMVESRMQKLRQLARARRIRLEQSQKVILFGEAVPEVCTVTEV